jgi:lysophospholipase L1-like esterase
MKRIGSCYVVSNQPIKGMNIHGTSARISGATMRGVVLWVRPHGEIDFRSVALASNTAFIIGDSISQGYRHSTEESLGRVGIATEWFSGGSSAQVLAGLPEWIPGKQPDLIQFNCGLHDARYFDIARTYQQPIENYELLLGGVVRWLQANTDAGLVWATTTPVIESRIMLEYRRSAEDVLAYNAVAKNIMHETGVSILDLHGVIDGEGAADYISPDGVHMTDSGYAVLAKAVSDGIIDRLADL